MTTEQLKKEAAEIEKINQYINLLSTTNNNVNLTLKLLKLYCKTELQDIDYKLKHPGRAVPN